MRPHRDAHGHRGALAGVRTRPRSSRPAARPLRMARRPKATAVDLLALGGAGSNPHAVVHHVEGDLVADVAERQFGPSPRRNGGSTLAEGALGDAQSGSRRSPMGSITGRRLSRKSHPRGRTGCSAWSLIASCEPAQRGGECLLVERRGVVSSR
jgi:hypothetical protein